MGASQIDFSFMDNSYSKTKYICIYKKLMIVCVHACVRSISYLLPELKIDPFSFQHIESAYRFKLIYTKTINSYFCKKTCSSSFSSATCLNGQYSRINEWWKHSCCFHLGSFSTHCISLAHWRNDLISFFIENLKIESEYVYVCVRMAVLVKGETRIISIER